MTRPIDKDADLWEKACEHLSNVFWWTSQRFTRLEDYHKRMSRGLAKMEPELRALQSHTWQNLPLKFLKGNTEAERKESLRAILDAVGGREKAVDLFVSQRMGQDRAILDASVLAVAHSSLDTALLFLCELTGLMDPEWWLDRLRNRKVALGEVRSLGAEHLCKEALRGRFDQLKREGVLEMFDRLTELTKPTDLRLTSGEKLERDRLVDLDAQRHRQVHGVELPSAAGDLPGDLEFLQQQTTLLIVAVAKEFEIFIHGGKITEFMKKGGELKRLFVED